MSLFKNLFKAYANLPRVVYILSFCMLINGMGNFIIPIITLILTQKIGLTPNQVGVYLGVYAVFQSILLMVNGKLLDSIGRKKVTVFCYILSAVSYFICFATPVSATSTVFIMISAIFFAMLTPAFNVLITDVTVKSNRRQAFSLTYLTFNIGNAISPVIAGLLFEKHLRFLFLSNSISIIICIFIIIYFLPLKHDANVKDKVIKPKMNNAKEQMSLLILIKQPKILLIASTMFIYQLAYSQWGFLLPLQMADIFSTKSSAYYGLIAGINGGIVIIFTPILTYYSKGFSEIKAIFLSGICYGTACGIFGITNHIIGFSTGMFIFTLGEILITLNYNALLAEYIPESHRGRILFILPILTGAGYVLGPILSGRFISQGYMKLWAIIGFAVIIIANINFRLLSPKC